MSLSFLNVRQSPQQCRLDKDWSRDAARTASVEVFCFLFFEEKKLVITVLFMTLVVSTEKDTND